MASLIHKIRIAVEFAGDADRGIIAGTQDELRDMIDIREGDQESFIDIYGLADAFRGFAMDIRAAERKGGPIVPVVGETDLPTK